MSAEKIALVDRREPMSRVEQLRYEGFEVEIPAELLETGDVILTLPSGQTVGIEVKTTSELVGLVPSGLSQLQQFQRMAIFDYRVLLVVGTFGVREQGKVLIDGWNRRSSLQYSAVQGALFNLQAALGFMVRHAGQENNVGRTVHNIWEHFTGNHTLLAKPRPITLATPQAGGLAVLMTLPGIGTVQAERLLKKYGTLQAVFEDLGHWTDIPGIGPKTDAAVHAFLTKEWTDGAA